MWQQTGSCAEVKPVEQESVSEAQKWIDLIFRAEGSGQCLLQQCQCSRSREPSPVHSQQLLGQLQREFMFLGQENKCCNSWGEILLRRRSLKEPSNQAWSGLEIHLGWSLLHSEVPQGEMFSLVFPLNFSFLFLLCLLPPPRSVIPAWLSALRNLLWHQEETQWILLKPSPRTLKKSRFLSLPSQPWDYLQPWGLSVGFPS